MKNELIEVSQSSINGQLAQTVNARDLHEFLESKRDFSNWIKDRIFQFGFEKGKDFMVFNKIGENPQSGRPVIEYHLTLDMAKEISMVERNAKGKEARQYFIECERQLRENKFNLPTNFKEALLQLVAQVEKTEMLEHENRQLENLTADLRPKADFHDIVCKSKGAHDLGETAKILNYGRNTLFKILKKRGFLMNSNVPYQTFIDRGYFLVQEKPYVRNGVSLLYSQTLVTAKGLIWLRKELGALLQCN